MQIDEGGGLISADLSEMYLLGPSFAPIGDELLGGMVAGDKQ